MRRTALLLLCLLSLLFPSSAHAEVTACGTVESDLGAGASKSPARYLELNVPAGKDSDIPKEAWDKLSQEIIFSNYSSTQVSSLSKLYETAFDKLRTPAEQNTTFSGQTSKAKVYATACVAGTSDWFFGETQNIEALNPTSFSLSAQATTPLKSYLTTLPVSPTRTQEIATSQTTTLTTLTSPTANDLPGLSLNLRSHNEGGSTKTYFDLCVSPAQNGCAFTEFVTEIEAGGETRVIVPGTYQTLFGNTVTWGKSTSTCVSSEQLPGIAPFDGSVSNATARVFGKVESADPNIKCEKFAAGVQNGGQTQPAICPGAYTPTGRTFVNENTCIAGSCQFRPLKIVSDVANTLLQKMTDAINICQGATNIAECLQNIAVSQTVPVYVYYYVAGGNYGLNVDNTTKTGFQPGFNNLFRPPQTEFSKQGAAQKAVENMGETYLDHVIGPVKTVYTQIQCDFLTPPGQESHCDKSENL